VKSELQGEIVYEKTLNKIYDDICNKISDLVLLQREVRDSTKRELDALNEYAASMADHPEFEDFTSSRHKRVFNCAKTGEPRFYGYKKQGIEDRRLAIFHHKNKQYQWLLVEAYEIFEDYLQSIYACAGYIDSSLWAMSDFGSISIDEIDSKDYEFYLGKANNKKGVPRSIICQFRKKFPDIQSFEESNKLNVDLNLAISIIEYLRHIIVHKRGWVDDKQKFIKLVLEKCGLYNNGKYKENHEKLISHFFGDSEYQNMVILLEYNLYPDLPIKITANRFEQLVSFIMAYSTLIAESLSDHLRKHITNE